MIIRRLCLLCYKEKHQNIRVERKKNDLHHLILKMVLMIRKIKEDVHQHLHLLPESSYTTLIIAIIYLNVTICDHNKSLKYFRTAISIDVAMDDDLEDGGTQEQIFEKLKLHKEVLSAVKHQPWPLRKKVKLVKQAKSYIRRHEGALQERLAQNRNTKDVLAGIAIFISKVC